MNKTDKQQAMQEFKLRRLVRKAIRLVEAKRNLEKKERLDEELRLRTIIRNLISETATPDTDPTPHPSTGINVLEDLLKKIIPVLEQDFKKLTTDGNQRGSYRSHIVQAVEDTLAPQKVTENPPGKTQGPGAIALPPTLGEQEDDININVGPENDEKFIDIEPKKQEEDPEDPRETFGIEGQDLTGRNVAFETFKKIETSIVDAYDVLGSDDDRDLFYDYLITNLKLYFDKFENDMGVDPIEEPTTDEYESQKSQAGEMQPEQPDQLGL